jgi:hypothetical protein
MERAWLTQRSWFALFSLFLCFYIVVGFFRKGHKNNTEWQSKESVDVVLPETNKTKSINARIWKKVELIEKIFSVGYWGSVYVDENGYIYTWDYDYRIKKFSGSGQLVMKFGSGRGKGQAEFVTPNDMVVDQEGNLWVADGSTGLVTVFRKEGSLAGTIRLQTMPFRIRVLSQDLFVVKKVFPSDYLFQVYKTDGTMLRQFGHSVFPQQSTLPILLSGTFDIDGRLLFFAPFYFGYIVCFDLATGEKKYLVESLDKIPMPKVETGEVGDDQAMRFSKDTQPATLDLRVEQDRILIKSAVTLREPTPKPTTVIDVFSTAEGRYLFSYRIPAWGFLKGMFFYQTGDTLLTKWKVQFLQE